MIINLIFSFFVWISYFTFYLIHQYVMITHFLDPGILIGIDFIYLKNSISSCNFLSLNCNSSISALSYIFLCSSLSLYSASFSCLYFSFSALSFSINYNWFSLIWYYSWSFFFLSSFSLNYFSVSKS